MVLSSVTIQIMLFSLVEEKWIFYLNYYIDAYLSIDIVLFKPKVKPYDKNRP